MRLAASRAAVTSRLSRISAGSTSLATPVAARSSAAVSATSSGSESGHQPSGVRRAGEAGYRVPPARSR
ncbi:hypothetical protein ACFQ0B_13440 [Nonomuraea thailandensis]